MKRKISVVIMLIVVTLIAVGCISKGTPEPEPNMVTGKISGGFTATVRELLPDYVLDDSTNTMDVVTEFQVKERFVVDIPEAQFEGGALKTVDAMNKYNLEIIEFREPTNEETGTSSPKIVMEKSK